MDLSDWREEYTKYNLKEADLSDNPHELFRIWFGQAVSDNNPEPNAMVLATSSIEPNARVVLLKEHNDSGFVFYTNYESQKAKDIERNPKVSLLFYWPLSQRQVRISGNAFKTTPEESRSYFDTRPHKSKISAIASPQSQPIKMDDLVERVREVERLANFEMPTNWGGYQVFAERFEFWQGQEGRLHDRIVYKNLDINQWEVFRLAP